LQTIVQGGFSSYSHKNQNFSRNPYTSCEPCLLCSFVITQIGFGRVVFAARGTDVPTYKPLLGADLTEAVAWVNAQPDWAHMEIVGDFMRERALKLIAEFSWVQAQTRSVLEPS
jgi:hypothetical protein